MKKKVILLASFAIIAGSGVLYAFNSSNKNAASCCSEKASCCTEQSCGTECSCGDECTGSGCECGCSCCE